MEIPIQSN